MLWSTLHGSHMVYITSGVSLLTILMPPWPGLGICQILRLATVGTMDPSCYGPPCSAGSFTYICRIEVQCYVSVIIILQTFKQQDIRSSK